MTAIDTMTSADVDAALSFNAMHATGIYASRPATELPLKNIGGTDIGANRSLKPGDTFDQPLNVSTLLDRLALHSPVATDCTYNYLTN